MIRLQQVNGDSVFLNGAYVEVVRPVETPASKYEQSEIHMHCGTVIKVVGSAPDIVMAVDATLNKAVR